PAARPPRRADGAADGCFRHLASPLGHRRRRRGGLAPSLRVHLPAAISLPAPRLAEPARARPSLLPVPVRPVCGRCPQRPDGLPLARGPACLCRSPLPVLVVHRQAAL